MKNFLLLITLFPVFLFAQNRHEKKQKEKADGITLSNIQAHIQYLASDKLEGRRTGTQGEILAMQYISEQFKKTGLHPKAPMAIFRSLK